MVVIMVVASRCFGVETCLGVGLQAKPSPMVHSLASNWHQALLFVVLDAIHSEFIPTLHQQFSGLFDLPVSKLAPVMQTGPV